MNGWLQITIAAKMSRLTSPLFIIGWKKSTVQPIWLSRGATDDHQTRNAEIYARVRAAILLKESEVSGELLARKIRELIQDPQLIQEMAANCSRLAPKDAAGRVATTMEKYTTHEPRF
ncbi:MAG: hypothetical protein DME90_00715 [Verrucomicrobia bacterium]|nr:MAG: hypothetical protein DME90_00715 [Verrucomicrobiota bacterium]